MSIQLKVSTQALENKSQEVDGQIKQVQQTFRNIEDIVGKTRGYWIGEAAESARQAFDHQKNDTELIIKRFKEHPRDLLTMAGVYKQGEEQVKQENNALETDVIV